MDETANLQFAYMASGQAQKHVTFNEALKKLDALVQLAVMSATTTAEPGSPSDGAVYIVPSGKTGTHWSSFADWALAYYRDGVWEEITPREGFVAYVKDSDLVKTYGGSSWSSIAGGVSDGDKGDVVVSASGAAWTIDTDAVTYAKLQNVSATARILARKSASAGDVEEATLSEILDFIGSAAQGDILYRGASTWARLGAGTSGYFLQTQGASANPQWAAASGGSLSDGDKGDVVVSSSGTVWMIDSDVVTYSKMQNVSATSRVLGRITAGAGDVEELTGSDLRTLAALATSDSPQFTAVNVGHASDTTIARTGAGDIAVEGNALYRAGGTDVAVADGGTGASTKAGAATNLIDSAAADGFGYLGAPQNSQSGAYTLAAADAGKHLYHPDADTSARTWTIPANGSVAFPIGTVIVIQNGHGAGALTLAITTDTLRWGASTGSRTIAAEGTATLLKVTSTVWRLTGDGIT